MASAHDEPTQAVNLGDNATLLANLPDLGVPTDVIVKALDADRQERRDHT